MNTHSQRVFDSFELSSDDLYIEVATDEIKKGLPPQTYYYTVADSITFYFMVELAYLNEESDILIVTSEVMSNWNITNDILLDTAVSRAVAIPLLKWHRFGRLSRVYEYQPYDPGWIPEFLSPEVILKLGLKGAPVAIVPHEDSLIVTGSRDWLGVRQLKKYCKVKSKQERPLTPQPLFFDEECREWRVFGN